MRKDIYISIRLTKPEKESFDEFRKQNNQTYRDIFVRAYKMIKNELSTGKIFFTDDKELQYKIDFLMKKYRTRTYDDLIDYLVTEKFVNLTVSEK